MFKILMVFLLGALASHGQVLKCTGVHDGDTLTVETATKKPMHVRLVAIDAPELNQAFGTKSQKALADLTLGKMITLKVTSKDRFGRSLAWVTVGDVAVNQKMITDGMAWQFTAYNKDAILRDAQSNAKNAKRGLWTDPNALAPWVFRKMEAAKRKKR